MSTASWGTYTGAGNADTLVVAGWTTSFADGISQLTEVWTQTSQPDGAWKGTLDLDPGRLPQSGVGPIGSQAIDEIVPLGSGFLATGEGTSDAATDTPIYFSAVWYSPNGRTWSKQPIQPPGLSAPPTCGAPRLAGHTSCSSDTAPVPPLPPVRKAGCRYGVARSHRRSTRNKGDPLRPPIAGQTQACMAKAPGQSGWRSP